MALEGTIKDFGLADILQLIGIQRKTGWLTLRDGARTVRVTFLEGQVVGAETQGENIEDRLGEVLTRTRLITEDELQQALRIQKETLQRIGFILVKNGAISEEDLSEALRIQVTQIVYRLFRWRQGEYRFDSSEQVEYDRDHLTPVSCETILMEGAQMVDEWPLIERRIKSPLTVFEKTPAALAATSAATETAVDSSLDDDLDFALEFGNEGERDRDEGNEKSEEVALSDEDRLLLDLVDGKRTIAEMVDLSGRGEFEIYRGMYDLANRGLVEQVKVESESTDRGRISRQASPLGRVAAGIGLLLGLVSLATLDSNPLTPFKLEARRGDTDRLRSHASRVRLERIESAIEVAFADLGAIPANLEGLVVGGYLEPDDLRDPWGRPYGFDLSDSGYTLRGLGPDAEPDSDLSITHTFTASRRMVLSGPRFSEASGSEATR